MTTTSENAIKSAADIGSINPKHAIGIAIILYEKAQNKFCFIVNSVCFPILSAFGNCFRFPTSFLI